MDLPWVLLRFVFTARCYGTQSTVMLQYAVTHLSVRLSVRLSVCPWRSEFQIPWSLGLKSFGERYPPAEKLAAQQHQFSGAICDNFISPESNKISSLGKRLANCNHSRIRLLNLMNFGPQTSHLTKKSPGALDGVDAATLTRLVRFLALTSVTNSFSDCASYLTPNQTRPMWLSGGS